jgi:hypothetical protein
MRVIHPIGRHELARTLEQIGVAKGRGQATTAVRTLDADENVRGGWPRHGAAVFEHNGTASASIIVLAT